MDNNYPFLEERFYYYKILGSVFIVEGPPGYVQVTYRGVHNITGYENNELKQ